MLISHICPTAWIPFVSRFSSCHLTLAHLVESDEQYVQNYLDAQKIQKKRMILDNSAFEMYKQGKPMYPADKLIDLGKKIEADYIVMPDYPNEHWHKTQDAARDIAPKLRDAGFGTFFVPQSTIGDIDGLLTSFAWAADSKHVDYIGVSILAIPNAYGVEKDNKLQRFLSRWHFMRLLSEEGILSAIKNNGKKIHFLGMVDGPNEIDLVGNAVINGYIDSWDSSSAVWHGINGIEYDTSPTGLINGKFEKEVDFDTKVDATNTAVINNIIYINSKVGVNDNV